jgi:catechol 2,3-dioxygenase-like lactoylglutathione lyase family enzyme
MPLSPHAVLETSLYVADLDRAVAFYENVLGLRQITDGYFEGGRGAALQVGSGSSVLLLFRADITQLGGILPAHGTTGAGHVAFRIEPRECDSWLRPAFAKSTIRRPFSMFLETLNFSTNI